MHRVPHSSRNVAPQPQRGTPAVAVISGSRPVSMSSEATGFTIADDGTFHAPLVLSYPYKRTMGPTMSRFLIGLRDQRIEGTVGSDGTIYVPPAERPESTAPMKRFSPNMCLPNIRTTRRANRHDRTRSGYGTTP